MTEALFLIGGLGLLFSLEKVRIEALAKPIKLKSKVVFSLAMDYLGQVTILSTLFFALRQMGAEAAPRAEWVHLFLFVAAYLLTKKTRKSNVFFVAVVSTCLWATSGSEGLSLESSVIRLLLVVGGVILFYFVFLAMRFRLAFCEVPAPFRLPAYFFLAALLSLALSVLTPHLIP